ncbi:hypothetical protein HJC23_008676 [Cyclotella cryptica]|uniref:Methyltransferase domain-containing protein n=1 Tax=Cyclotella cryptica TaxID=29204 RepID=A0ABD3QHD8_9STRA|eukprot:CCRYP_005390-RA/>CCRYP_005390-RA protein AED:0.00 eAED:0.00 QI:0/-1/0/1/-1/1/1/0/438
MAITSKTSSSTLFSLQGKLVRKKKVIPNLLRLHVQGPQDPCTTPVYIPGDRSEECCNHYGFNIFYLDSILHVKGYVATDNVSNESVRIVEECTLITCAPNVKMIKDVISHSNCISYATTLGMEPNEMGQLMENNSQKTVMYEIISKLKGGGVPKAPPRKRNARLKYPDMQILQSKEDEGANSTNSWTLCAPCNTIGSLSFSPRKQPISNLPDGADGALSHHHKLTRSEYLEHKKNHQTAWFVERMRRFKSTPRLVLDVGGGRGDLAVQIAREFQETKILAVDCNATSIEAGKMYAKRCCVEDRIEFVKMNFSEYVEEYEASAKQDYEIDCIVALHACGDLSDMALSFARSIRCENLIVVPCCYPKRYLAPFIPYWHSYCKEEEVDSLTRLVELDDHPEVSRRAMVVINSMRRSAFGNHVMLEYFDSKISKRNIAIVGD